MNEIHCQICGEKETAFKNGYFDPRTGKPTMTHKCFNPSCERGKEALCVKSGGHYIHWWGSKCRQCGYVEGCGSL